MNATNRSVYSCPGQGAGTSFRCAGEAKSPVPELNKNSPVVVNFYFLNSYP